MIVTVTATKRPERIPFVLESYKRQARKPDGAVFVTPAGQDFNELKKGIEELGINSVFMIEPSRTLGHIFAVGTEEASKMITDGEGLICVFDDDNWYGPFYLKEAEDFILTHPDVAIIGKPIGPVQLMDRPGQPILGAHGTPIMETDFTNGPGYQALCVSGSSIAINIKSWNKYPMLRYDPNDPMADVGILGAAIKIPVPIYVTSEYNYMFQRYSNPSHKHVWEWKYPPEEKL